MRILYENQIDDLDSSLITALTETTFFEATHVQDERLSYRWKPTACTDQTILFDAGGTVTEGESAQPMFQATTNLVSDPTLLTWTGTASVTVATSINGVPAAKVTNLAAGDAYVSKNHTLAITGQTIISAIARYVDADQTRLYFSETGIDVLGYATITFSTKSVSYQDGVVAMPPIWIDDRTVRVFMKPLTITNSTSTTVIRAYASIGGATGQSTIWSAPMLHSGTYPLAYTATTRSAWATAGNVAFRLPPSGKFIVDCEFTPYFPYNNASSLPIVDWFVSATQRLLLQYNVTPDALRWNWQDAGTLATLTGSAFDAGTTQTVNQRIRCVTSFALGSTTSSRIFTIPRKKGSFSETTGVMTDPLSTSTFTTMSIGRYGNVATPGDILGHYFRVRGGSLDSVISTEADLDAELETKPLLHETEYQGAFDVDAVAIMGHTITAGASIKAELNDWNEWNYTDGSGSSIIQRTLTWNEDTILNFLSSRAKWQYVRFTINDPGNAAGNFEVGRIWIGKYLTISPSSLDDFRVTTQTTDRVIRGINRQKWADEGVQWRRFELTFPKTDGTSAMSMLAKVQRMYDYVGNAHSLIFCNFDSIRDYQIVEPCYASVVGEISYTHRKRQSYGWGLTLEEDM